MLEAWCIGSGNSYLLYNEPPGWNIEGKCTQVAMMKLDTSCKFPPSLRNDLQAISSIQNTTALVVLVSWVCKVMMVSTDEWVNRWGQRHVLVVLVCCMLVWDAFAYVPSGFIVNVCPLMSSQPCWPKSNGLVSRRESRHWNRYSCRIFSKKTTLIADCSMHMKYLVYRFESCCFVRNTTYITLWSQCICLGCSGAFPSSHSHHINAYSVFAVMLWAWWLGAWRSVA